MVKLVVRSFATHKMRFFLTGLSIVLGVGFIASTLIYTDTINAAFSGIFEEAFEGIDVQVSGDSEFSFAEPPTFPEGVAADVAEVPGVEQAIPTLQRTGVQLVDDDGEAFSMGGAPNIGGYYPAEFGNSFTALEIADGGRPPAGPGEVVVDAGSAEDLDLQVGDDVGVISTTVPETGYRVVGIVRFAGLDSLGGATFALFDLPTIQQLTGLQGSIDGVSVLAEPGTDVVRLVADVQQALPEGITAVSAQDAAEAEAAEIEEGLAFFGTILLAFGGIALFVGMFIIYNTFRIIVVQRTRELALLRALGASGRQVLSLVVGEALLVSVIASIVGVIVGLLLAVGLQALLNAIGFTLPSTTLQLRPRTVIVGLIVGVGATMVSAYLPARRASRVAPLAALRDQDVGPTRRSLTQRGFTGAVVVVVGVGVLFLGLFGDVDLGVPDIALVGLGAAVTLIGVTVISPLVARPVSRVIGAPFAGVQKVPGRLAQENAMRTPRRTSATAGAIMVGVALVALASVMAASISGTVDELIDRGLDADLFVQPTNQFSFTGFTPELAERIAQDPEVDSLTTVRQGAALIDNGEVFVAGVEDNFTEFVTFDELTGSSELSNGGIAVDRGDAESNGYQLGQGIDVTFADGVTESLTIRGIYAGPGFSGFAIGQDVFAERNPTTGDQQVYVKLVAGTDVLTAQTRIEALAADVPTAEVLTLEELRSSTEEQINTLVNGIIGLLGLAVVISLFGVTNTMTLSVYERTREIGLLRAVGMSRRQTRQMVRSEASIISVFGAVLGVGVGIFFGWALIRALEDEGFTSFVVPVTTLGVWVLVIGLLGLLFALVPAWRASRLNVLEAIAYE